MPHVGQVRPRFPPPIRVPARVAKAKKNKQTATADETVHRLLVSLGEPPTRVWRRIWVPSRIKLSELSKVIQKVMGWEGEEQLHQFGIAGKNYGPPGSAEDQRVYDDSKVTLGSLVEPGDAFGYLYDFDDQWDHAIDVEAVRPIDPAVTYPICVSGARACPPDGAGGVEEYEHIQDVLIGPQDAEYDELVEELGASFDPEAFTLADSNRRLHGKDVAPPADEVIDPALEPLIAPTTAAIAVWWRDMHEGDDKKSAVSDAEVVATVARAVAGREDQLHALDERCGDRLLMWAGFIPPRLAKSGQLDRALEVADVVGALQEPSIRRPLRAMSYAMAGGHAAETEAEVTALLEERKRDSYSLVMAAKVYGEIKQPERVEALTREVLALEGADENERDEAAFILADVLRSSGREDEALAIEMSIFETGDDDEEIPEEELN